MVNDRSFVASQTGGREGGVKFSKRHDFISKGVNFTNAQNVRGGRNIKTEDWPSM